MHQGMRVRRDWMMSVECGLFVVLLWLMPAASFSQTPSPAVIRGFNGSKYYPAPHFAQMEMKLTSKEAVELPGKQYQVMQPHLTTFTKQGVKQVEIESTYCLYNEPARLLNSQQHVMVKTGDGRSRIEGDGFSFQQKENLLIISNNVHAVIENPANRTSPLVITSRWFEYNDTMERGVFHGNVRGEDADQVFTCGVLTVTARTNATRGTRSLSSGSNTNLFDLIEAEGGLKVDGKSKTGHASARRGSFRQAEQRVDLVGDAGWSFNGYSGNAERMTVWLSNTNIDATGEVRLQMPQSALGAAGGLLSATNTSSKFIDTNIVTLFADRFIKRGDQLLAEGKVRINYETNQLTCDKLEGKQPAQDSPEGFSTATGNVTLENSGATIKSDRADYTKLDNKVVFTGNPRFVKGEIQGKATRVTMWTLTKEVLAENDVEVAFPFSAGSGSLLGIFPGANTNSTSERAQIVAQNFRLRDRLGKFSGGVEVRELPHTGGESRLLTSELEVRLATDKRHAESLQARRDVVYEKGIVGVTNGPNTHVKMTSQTLTATAGNATNKLAEVYAGGGVCLTRADRIATGDRAIFTNGDKMLKLFGNPQIKASGATFSSERELIWDVARETAVGSGYKITVSPETLKNAEDSLKLKKHELRAKPT